MKSISLAKDKTLFTPGPLTTSQTVKQAMLRDLGSRDAAFIAEVAWIRQRLLELGEVADAGYEAILMQGAGTFGLEAIVATVTPPDGKWLILINGAYGHRMAYIAAVLGVEAMCLIVPEDVPVEPETVAEHLAANPDVTHVACVHCETTSGIMNPVEAIGPVVKAHGKLFFVDAMSSFGAVPLNLQAAGIDFLVSSANKCIEGVPGFSFVLAEREALLACEGNARSISLDLLAQWQGLENNGQFRFTPPTHTLLAFAQALREHEAEGGVQGRGARYRRNYELMRTGMARMGFREYLAPEHQGFIISSYHYPAHPNFDFQRFYDLLSQRDLVIYPGKLTQADCFRIGHIGRLFEADVHGLLVAIHEVLLEMTIEVPLPVQ